VHALDVAVPPRLGRSFRWLLATSIVNNAGDGIGLAAFPLLVASQTRDPFLVSLALFAAWLPNLLFAVPAGAIADRVDRVRMVSAVNFVRAAVLAVLVIVVLLDSAHVWLLYVCAFGLGLGETLHANAAQAILPVLVDDAQLVIDLRNATGRAGISSEKVWKL